MNLVALASIAYLVGIVVFNIKKKIEKKKMEKKSAEMNRLFRESKSYSEYLDKLGIRH